MRYVLELGLASVSAFAMGMCLSVFSAVPSHAAEVAPATQAAISAFYVGDDAAQKAMDLDWCSGKYDVDTVNGDKLSGNDHRQYEHMSDALMAAFAASGGSDSAVEAVNDDFCAAAGER